MPASRILVTGATGYIGGRLVSRLLASGRRVRLLVRDPQRIKGKVWQDDVEVVQGDLLDPASLERAFTDTTHAYYLVHSMEGNRDFAQRDRESARNVVTAAGRLPDFRHLIYLGGLIPQSGASRSKHLTSRAEVGEILRADLPCTEFRAGPVIGSGSASFEMIRYLTERLPVMLTPSWIRNDITTIAIRDVLAYLQQALDVDPLGVVDIGSDTMTFKQLMLVYAEARGLKRTVIPTPFLAPTLAARWVGFVTPIPNSLAIPLVRGVVHSLYADTGKAEAHFPTIKPLSYRQAVELALQRVGNRQVETRWSDALGNHKVYSYEDREGLIRERRNRYVAASPERVYQEFASLGGERGWLFWNWAWRLRGLMDRLIGGPGLRRGRRDKHEVRPGDAIDFWRAETVEPGRLLRLRAEMKVPGNAWLEWQVQPEGEGSRLSMQAIFEPKGFLGILYWKAMFPAHHFIFDGMADRLKRDAEQPEHGGKHTRSILKQRNHRSSD